MTRDLGDSYFTDVPVAEELMSRAASSLTLVVPAIVLGVLVGVGAGTLAAFHSGGRTDRIVNGAISLGQSVPEFLIGVLLIYVFFALLGWAPPATGQLDFTSVPPPVVTGSALIDGLLAGQWSTVGVALSHLVLPVATLVVALAPELAKTTRASVTEALQHPSVEFHRANGMPTASIVRSVVAQARTPVITYIGIIVAVLAGGSAVVELLFNWNGVGSWALGATTQLDIPAIQAVVLVYGGLSLLVYLSLEVLVTTLDPRLSFGAGPRLRRARAVAKGPTV
ncbi:ABC transporter permease [Pseudonocardia sp. NPDC049635]|uniref:ABC transporter permease n=1 Tax=Pseudonocardia sp. NPDC049635 TaxID=3155506 RepID=UPI0034059CED